jgi:catechol 2,3-dioxygenase-like lactoylglutathione lyase family enzyme
MRLAAVFLVGLAFGMAMSTALAQGNRLPGTNYLNHVGISVANFDEAFAFYTEKMGFREAFTVRDEKGQPVLAYVQVSRNTFVELQPANASRPPGLTHFGLHVENLREAVASLKRQGVTVEDPRAGRQDSSVANATDPGGVRIELFEFGPQSLQQSAIDSWK